ncbi:DUF3786 domain-containing protein [Chloroflexota bacterium]
MLIGDGQHWSIGEDRAWQRLLNLDPVKVCRNAKADFDESSNLYALPLFNTYAFISPGDRRIWGDSPLADMLLNELAHYSRLSALWYLIQSRDIPISGNLIKPREISGGLIFERGSHILPLDNLAYSYGNDIKGFVERAVTFGGEQMNYGDAFVRFLPFPRIPVAFLLWSNDNEFPSRAEILFDSTCSQHLPVDILWSIAMMSLLAIVSHNPN